MPRRALLMSSVAGLSGLCSLVYQVVWDRTLRFNFGGDTVASAIVTASFLLGLGIGAMLFGRWRANPIRTLAFLELGIGGFAMVSYPYLTSLAAALGAALHATPAGAGGLRAAVIAGCVLFIVPPSVLMGGTLPLLFNWFIPPAGYASRLVGMVYGLNTLGAAAGILVAPFVFLNNVSIPAALWIVGGVNLAFGAGLLIMSRAGAPFPGAGSVAGEEHAGTALAHDKSGKRAAIAAVSEEPASGEAGEAASRVGAAQLLALSFLSGFVVLAFEMSALRNSFVVRPSNPYNFPAILMPFLLALALGSMTFTRFARYGRRRALRRLGLLLAGAPLAMIAGVWASSYVVLFNLSMSPFRYLFPYLIALVVPYAFLAGGVFPLLLRVAAETGRELPRRTGVIYLVNSAGSFCGALLTQFLGFPLLGTRGVLTLLLVAGIGAGAYLLWAAAASPHARSGAADAGEAWSPWARLLRPPWLWPAAAALLLVPLLVPRTVWIRYTFGLTTGNFDAVEGSSGMATIEWDEDGSWGDVRVNGMYMSALPDHPKHILLAGFALSLPQRARVLVLGLGGGGMVHKLIVDPGVHEVVAVDWSRELPVMLDLPRPARLLGDTLHRSDVTLIKADARVAVSLFADDRFDVIIDNLAAGRWVGATNIKSVAYYAQIARILAPGGVFVYDANYSTHEQEHANQAALLTAFEHVRQHPRWVVLASNDPLHIDPARVEQVFAARPELEIEPPYADWVLGQLRTIDAAELAGVEPIRDERPVYEYTVHPLRGLLDLLGF